MSSYPPGCSGTPFDYESPIHPLSNEVWGLLENFGVDESVIQRICTGIDELATRADATCPQCEAEAFEESMRHDPEYRPISDSASGVGSSDASGEVDLSGVKVGDKAETRAGVAECRSTTANGWRFQDRGVLRYEWFIPGVVGSFLTDRTGKACYPEWCIIRLLPENGGGT